MSITLPHEMAAMVRAKVVSGEYASESEVIREGLRILQARDIAVDKWLHDEIVKMGDEEADDPGLRRPAEHEFIVRLRAARRRAKSHKPGRADRERAQQGRE